MRNLASAAAEAWFARRLLDLLAPSKVKEREANEAKERALSRAKAEGVDVSQHFADATKKPTKPTVTIPEVEDE